MTFGDRLKTARKNKGYTQETLANIIGVAKSTLTGYERGNREPDVLKIKLLANALGVTGDELIGITDKRSRPVPLTSREQTHITKYRKCDTRGRDMVDVVLDYEYNRANNPEDKTERPDITVVDINVYDESAAAGVGNYLSGNDYEVVQFSRSDVPSKTDYGVRINGDSMEPQIPNGAIVFVQHCPAIDSGEVGIFAYNGEGYCKKIHIDEKNHEIRLESVNPKYKPMVITDGDFHTYGRVLGNTKIK